MPKLFKCIQEYAAKKPFFRSSTGIIHNIHSVAPQLKRITLKGSFDKFSLRTGDTLHLQIAGRGLRAYTISQMDLNKGLIEILVYLQGYGNTSQWFRKLLVGDQLHLFRRNNRLKFQPGFTQHFAFGDETSLGWLQSFKEQASRMQHDYLCLVELEKGHQSWPGLLQLEDVMVVEKTNAEPARAAIEKIQLPGEVFKQRWSNAAFYLSGNSKSVQAFKKSLIDLGIPSKNIQSAAFWKNRHSENSITSKNDALEIDRMKNINHTPININPPIDTIFSRLKSAAPDLSDAAIIEAADKSKVIDFAWEFRDGLQTPIEPDGQPLSDCQLEQLNKAITLLQEK